MPKTPSNKLFNLVKSLSGSEKRYFKLFIHDADTVNSKYAQLFDLIEEQDVFDDEALRHAIYGDEPMETRKYSELKSYLYELIVKSLQSYDEKSSVDYRVKNMLLGVRTLFKRSLFDDCKGLLKKVRKVAEDHEHFSALMEILDWEKKIAYARMDIDFLDRELGRISDEQKIYTEKLTNIQSYRSLFFKILISIRKDVSRRKTQIDAHKALMKHPLMQSENMALSFQAKVLFYRIQSIYHFSVSETEQFYQSGKKLIKLMEGNPLMLKEDVSEYISALNNFIISCGKLGKHEEVRTSLDKLSRVNPITLDDQVKIHRQYYSNKFSLCIHTGAFKEGKRELEKHRRELKKLDRQVFLKSDYYFQYFYIYFGCEDYETALNYLNEWLSSSGSVERQDLQSLARILNLVIHYELGNIMLLDSLFRSTYRFLNKENRLSELERKFMHFLKEISKPHSKKELKQAFIKLRQDFESLSKLPSYKTFGLFDLHAWLESKISGKSFAQVVKEKASASAQPV